MKTILLALASLLLAIPATTGHGSKSLSDIQTIYQWPLLEFGFPTPAHYQRAVADGNLEPSNAIPIDVAPHYSVYGFSRLFTTIPRFTTGVPYSLAVVTPRMGRRGPKLQAYPNYNWHSSHGANCDGITSAFRVAITECQQMWVIDSGMIGSEQHCPPQLLLFDLTTDRLVHRYRFKENTYTPGASLLITPVIDVQDPPPMGLCRRTMVYIGDVNLHGIVVYDFARNVAWRAENRFMYPDPTHGTHTIAGESFTLMDGIFGMSTDQQNLYFHPLASVSEYVVPLQLLNNRTIWQDDPEAVPEQFRLIGKRSSQCAAEAMDHSGNIYCVTFDPIKLISWNVRTPYEEHNFHELAVGNQELLEFVSGMKVVKNNQGRDELWMMSNRFQKIAADTLNPNEVNFRILKLPLYNVHNIIETGMPKMDLHNKLIFG